MKSTLLICDEYNIIYKEKPVLMESLMSTSVDLQIQSEVNSRQV